MSALAIAEPDDGVAVYRAEVERVCTADPRVSPIAGGILAGITLDIAHDSRSFASMLGIEHALVLRAMHSLVELGRLVVIRRDERTQRCRYGLSRPV